MLKLGKTYSECDLGTLAARRAATVGQEDRHAGGKAFRGFFADSLNRGHWWADEAVQMVRIAPLASVAGEAETEEEFARLAADAAAHAAAAHAAAAEGFARLATASDGRAAYEEWIKALEKHCRDSGGDFGISPPEWGRPLVHTTGSGRSLFWWEPTGFRGLLVCRPPLPGWEGPDFETPGASPWGGPAVRGSTPVFSRLFEFGGSVSTARETIRLRPGRPGFFAVLTRQIRVDSSYAPAPGPWAVLEVGTIGGGGADPGSVAEARHVWDVGFDFGREPDADSKVLAAARTAIEAVFGPQDWTEPARPPEAVPEAVADTDTDVEAD